MTHHQPPQHQNQQPGKESKMQPKPISDNPSSLGSNKLANMVALISGGDSGIGRAVAIAFAKEGADVAIIYLNEHDDAKETARLVQEYGKSCLCLAGDVTNSKFCQQAVQQTFEKFGQINILVNNAAKQFPQDNFLNITPEQLDLTFKTNIYAYFYLAQAVLPHLHANDSIINTTSVTAYKGSAHLIDYAATKGAIVAFTRSLSEALVSKQIRVNAVAPGPIWTPLIPATFSAEQVAEFGEQVPMQRAGQPSEVASSYVFLASSDSSYMSGQVLHPNGGVVVNG